MVSVAAVPVGTANDENKITFGNRLSGGPKLLQTHDCTLDSRVSRVSKVRVRVRLGLTLGLRLI